MRRRSNIFPYSAGLAAFALLLAALMLAVPAGRSGAQLESLTGTEAASSPSPQASPDTAPTPIQLSDVVSEAEEVTRRLQAAERRFGEDTSVDEIGRELESQTSEINDLRRRTEQALARMPALDILERFESEWKSVSAPIPSWKSTLQVLADGISGHLGYLRRAKKSWEDLRDSTRSEPEPTAEEGSAGNRSQNEEQLAGKDVPAAIRQKIATTIGLLENAERSVTRRQKSALTLQARISERERVINAVLDEIRSERDDALSSLLVRDSRPIWEPGAVEQDIRTEFGVSFNDMAGDLNGYAYQFSSRFLLHLALTLLLILGLFRARRRTRQLIEEEPKLRRALAVFEVPVASAFLLSIFLSGFIYPKPPELLKAILSAAILVPGYLVLHRIVQRPVVPTLTALVVLFLADVVRGLFVSVTYFTRVFLLVETVVAIAFLIWLFRTRRGVDESRPDHSRLAAILHAIVPFAAIPFVIALIANLLGIVGLARFLAEGMLRSAYYGLLLYAIYMVIDSLIVYAFRVRPLSDLLMIRNHRELLHKKISNLFKWAAVIFWSVLLLSNYYVLDPVVETVRDVLTAELSVGSLTIRLSDILLFILAVWFAFLLSRVIRFVLEEDVYPRINLGGGVGYAVSTILHYVVLLIGFFIAISAAGIDLSRFAILAGAFGVGLGFGLQAIVNNFVSGIILLFERPFKVGDMIQVGDQMGSLKSIGLRASVVATPEGADVIVPNGQLLSEEVINWMAGDQTKRLDVNVGVKYGTDPKRVMEVLAEVGNGHPDILIEPPPQTMFIGFGDNSMDFQLRAWADNETRWWITRSDLYAGVYYALTEAGIEIPFPQRDLHLKSVEGKLSDVIPKERTSASTEDDPGGN